MTLRLILICTCFFVTACEWKAADDFFPDGFGNKAELGRQSAPDHAAEAQNSLKAQTFRKASNALIAKLSEQLDSSDLPVMVMSERARGTFASSYRTYFEEALVENGYTVVPYGAKNAGASQNIYLDISEVDSINFPDQFVLSAVLKDGFKQLAAAHGQFTFPVLGDHEE